MPRRIRSAEEMYNDLVEDIQFCYESVFPQHIPADDFSAHYMLTQLLKEAKRAQELFDRIAKDQQESIDQNMATIHALFKKLGAVDGGSESGAE